MTREQVCAALDEIEATPPHKVYAGGNGVAGQNPSRAHGRPTYVFRQRADGRVIVEEWVQSTTGAGKQDWMHLPPDLENRARALLAKIPRQGQPARVTTDAVLPDT
jgi:hypothetical protein